MRFKSLPNAKRYPTTAFEWDTLLARHREITDYVLLPGAPCQLFVLSAAPTTPAFAGLSLRQIRMPYGWRNFRFMDGGNMHTVERRWNFIVFEQLLRLRADDRIGPVGVWNPARQIIYSPYDGGADIYSADVDLAHKISAKFSRWRMAPYPD